MTDNGLTANIGTSIGAGGDAAGNLAGWIFVIDNPLIWLLSGLLLVSLLLTLRACWRRLWPRKPKRAMIVVLLNLIAFCTVFVLLAEPQRRHLAKRDVLLITEGAKAIVPADAARVYVAPGVEATKAWVNTDWLLDVAQLKLRQPALAGIDVQGYGLTAGQWQGLPADIRITFTPPPLNGFTAMHWPRTLVAGETIQVSGRYTHQENPAGIAIIQLRLLDPAGRVVAQARIKNGAYFSLPLRPKSPGNLAYVLQALHGQTLSDKTLEKEALLSEQLLAVSVNTAPPIRIMVEQSAPSFETKQLRNYAAGNGALVLINTQISRGKSISQSANLPDDAEIGFSPLTLAQSDVLIVDGRALVDFSSQQRQWLNDAIEQGLGVLVFADTSLLEQFAQLDGGLLAGFELDASTESNTEVAPRLMSEPASGQQQSLAEQSVQEQLLPVAAMQLRAVNADVLIDDGHGNALVISKPKGLGNIAISLIRQSHRWLTSGKRELWSDYWAALIAAISRARASSYLLAPEDTTFYQPGDSVTVCAMSASGRLVVTVSAVNAGDGQSAFEIPLTADSLGSARHCGGFQTQHSGWHQLSLRTEPALRSEKNGPLLDQQGVYVTGNNQWLAQKRWQRVNASYDRLAHNRAANGDTAGGKWVFESIDNAWLWLILVLSASLLWLERKIDFGAVGR